LLSEYLKNMNKNKKNAVIVNRNIDLIIIVIFLVKNQINLKIQSKLFDEITEFIKKSYK